VAGAAPGGVAIRREDRGELEQAEQLHEGRLGLVSVGFAGDRIEAGAHMVGHRHLEGGGLEVGERPGDDR